MSTGEAQNEMRRQALRAVGLMGKPRLALIDTYDPNTYSAKVLIQPEGTGTGWLPIASQWFGNGWGAFFPPSSGDQVLVLFQESSVETGLIVCGLFSDEDRPLNVPSGEGWLVHQSTSALKFHNDGSVDLIAKQNLSLTVGGDVVAQVTGRVTATASEFDLTGNVKVNGSITATGDVKAGSISLEGHTHGGVQSGGAKTAPPS